MIDLPIWIDETLPRIAGSDVRKQEVSRPCLLAEVAAGIGGIELRGFGWTPGGDVQVFAHFPGDSASRGTFTGPVDGTGGFTTFVHGSVVGGAIVTAIDVTRGASAQVSLAPATERWGKD